MVDPLPRMPLRVGDPGLFICGPADIAPWESAPVRKRADAGVGSAHVRARTSGWLVLSICPRCTPAHGGRYCQEHNERNWWLTHFSSGRKPSAPSGPYVPRARKE
jgi:hypothetical protein